MAVATEALVCEVCHRSQQEVGEMVGISERYDGRIMCDTCAFAAYRHVWGV